MRISHVSCGVRDLDDVARRLRSTLGLGLWRFPGDVGAHLPLDDRQYVELYGRAHPLWREGWIAWAVAVEAIDDWISVLGLDDDRTFGDDPTKTFTPWRGRLAATTISRASGGAVPYLIEYDANVDLDAVFAEKHRMAGHDATVGAIQRIRTDGTTIRDVAVEIDGEVRTLPLP